MIESQKMQFRTRHASPFPYTQQVPLVLFGRGFVKAGFSTGRGATVADLAPTYAELLDFEGFPERNGRVLQEALLPPDERNGSPRLIFTIVWDGAGRNVLRRWPRNWPVLRSVMSRGASYRSATVASHPSNTAPVHTTIGTGSYPSTHGISDMRIRVGGEMVDPWHEEHPRRLLTRTLADLWDPARGNEPLIAMMANSGSTLGMIGHGAQQDGGDRDIAVMLKAGLRFGTRPDFYSMPDYLDLSGLRAAVRAVDARDGRRDGRWLGHPISASREGVRWTPAWTIVKTKRIIDIVKGERFGADVIADLFYVNYKNVDKAHHLWNMVEPEVRSNLSEQDRQLRVLIGALNETVGRDNYVLALTADHGLTPPAKVRRRWSIDGREVVADVQRRFDKVNRGRKIVKHSREYSLFLSRAELEANGVAPGDIARFLRRYRVEDNITRANKKLLDSYSGTRKDLVFLTALTPVRLKAALGCTRPN
jgi:hypothetical protein